MKVSINGVRSVEGYFDTREVVIDQCFKTIEDITIQNTDNNAWRGWLTVTINGVRTPLICEECGGSPFDKSIVVDGDSRWKYYELPTNCRSGDGCLHIECIWKKG